ncbi:hypothetical protein XELAEV_18036451mg [Xenopus laevis]|uniref:Uncharacterized protein n=1 Tax=Xenopus laevis TaxID=8355 RepID=A0A974HD04_XENLA|nr:hypothetical protein XELAEV_18036451mg [Xenopus laevis]
MGNYGGLLHVKKARTRQTGGKMGAGANRVEDSYLERYFLAKRRAKLEPYGGIWASKEEKSVPITFHTNEYIKYFSDPRAFVIYLNI